MSKAAKKMTTDIQRRRGALLEECCKSIEYNTIQNSVMESVEQYVSDHKRVLP